MRCARMLTTVSTVRAGTVLSAAVKCFVGVAGCGDDEDSPPAAQAVTVTAPAAKPFPPVKPRLAGTFAIRRTDRVLRNLGGFPGPPRSASWRFTPRCGEGRCRTVLRKPLSTGGFEGIVVRPQGNRYAGTALRTGPGDCEGEKFFKVYRDRITVTLRVSRTAVRGGERLATRIRGTYRKVGQPRATATDCELLDTLQVTTFRGSLPAGK